MTDDQSRLGDFYDPTSEFDDGADETGLESLHYTTKRRRLRSPKSDDEWPGTWEKMESSVSRLPSLRNDDGSVIRVHEDDSEAKFKAFVHIAKGSTPKKEWTAYAGEWDDVHDSILEFMERHP